MGATRVRPSLAARIASALPDLVAAGFFLLLWIMPGLLGADALKTGLLIMLVEFILIHASAMIGGSFLKPGVSRGTKLLGLLGFAAMYLIFIVGYCFIFRQWWPLLAFAVLLVGKASLAFDRELPSAERQQRLSSGWALSCLAYLGGVFLTLFLPLPRLGLSTEVVAAAGLEGGGHWVEHPHTVVAFGLIYFGFLAWTKIKDIRLAT